MKKVTFNHEATNLDEACGLDNEMGHAYFSSIVDKVNAMIEENDGYTNSQMIEIVAKTSGLVDENGSVEEKVILAIKTAFILGKKTKSAGMTLLERMFAELY